VLRVAARPIALDSSLRQGRREASVMRGEAEAVEIQIDESEWPLVVVRWTGRPSDASLVAGLVRLDTLLARGERFGMIVDTRGGEGLTPEQRRMLLSHMKRNVELNTKYLVQAFVANDLLSRSLYWGVQLLMPSPFPTKVFRDFDAGRAWVRAILAGGNPD
jgi:hypothetical protein